jgi:hypothetical protein
MLLNPYRFNSSVADQLWSNVKLLLDGQSFQDLGPSGGGRVATITGAAALSNAQTKWGAANSIRLPSSADYIQFATSADWALGTSDFCLEFWARFDALVLGQTLLSIWTGGSPAKNWMATLGDGGVANSQARPTFAATNNSGFTFPNARVMVPTANSLLVNTWHFIEFGRAYPSFYIRVDGTKYTYTDPANNGALNMDVDIPNAGSIPLKIGGFAGYIQDVRLTVGPGSNRYGSGNSVVPIGPFPTHG